MTGLGLLKIKTVITNAKSYQKYYWIDFVTSFFIKLKNLIIRLPNGFSNLSTMSLKKRSKFTKKYHINLTTNNKETLDIQSSKWTSLINESKNRYIAKISAKLDHPKFSLFQCFPKVSLCFSITISHEWNVWKLGLPPTHHWYEMYFSWYL